MPPDTMPPPGVNIVDSGPPAAPPPPVGEIRPSDLGPGRSDPPKPGTARSRMYDDLSKRAKNKRETPAAAEPKRTQTPPADETPPERPGEETPPSTPEGEQPPEHPAAEKPEQPSAIDPKSKAKANPWKLVDQYKQRAAELEKQLADSKTMPDGQKKQYLDQIENLQKKNSELEDEIRFVNYSKSDEFQAKYAKPYEDAWKRAMGDLNEIQVVDAETGEGRPARAQDLLALVQMPLGDARKIANSLFGEFADDVMQHRKEIKRLLDEQTNALTEAKTKGAERDKQKFEMSQKRETELKTSVREAWTKANQEALTNEKFGVLFKPIEGDADGNSRLETGFKLVDRAFSSNPLDPNLTPEQRADVVRIHAAVRNRAAAFGRLHSMYSKALERATKLEAELKKYKSSTPNTGGAGATTPPAANQTAKDSVFGALAKLAKH